MGMIGMIGAGRVGSAALLEGAPPAQARLISSAREILSAFFGECADQGLASPRVDTNWLVDLLERELFG